MAVVIVVVVDVIIVVAIVVVIFIVDEFEVVDAVVPLTMKGCEVVVFAFLFSVDAVLKAVDVVVVVVVVSVVVDESTFEEF